MSGINFEVWGSAHVAVIAMIRGRDFVKTIEVDETFHSDGCPGPVVEVGKFCPECGTKNTRNGKRTRRVINHDSLPDALVEKLGDVDEWDAVHQVAIDEVVRMSSVGYHRDNPQPYLYVAFSEIEISTYAYSNEIDVSYNAYSMPDVDDVVGAASRIERVASELGLDVFDCRIALVPRG